MHILFIGTHVPNDIEAVEPGISSAGNRFQNNFIKNVRELGHEVDEVSFIAVPIKDPAAFNDSSRYVLKSGNPIKSVKAFHDLIRAKETDCDIIICYNIVYAWLNLPKLARKAHIKSIAIIADYSEEDSYKSFARKVYVKLQRSCMRKFDKIVGLSANIEKQLKPKQQFVLVEGGIDRAFYDKFDSIPEKAADAPVTVMYSGLLEPVTGVDLFLDAIKKIDKSLNAKFVFTGKGSFADKITQAANEDSRIDFKGNLSYDDYIDALRSADILVNPRNMQLPENRNNFPSKVLDYLATGKTIISTKFVGWEKFDGHIIFTDEAPLAETITKTITGFKTSGIADATNRSFVEQFLWENQISRIIENGC